MNKTQTELREVHTLIARVFGIKLWLWKFDIKITSLRAVRMQRNLYLQRGYILPYLDPAQTRPSIRGNSQCRNTMEVKISFEAD